VTEENSTQYQSVTDRQTDRQTDRHGFNTMKHTHTKKTEKGKLKLKKMKEKIPRLHHRKSSTVWVKKSPLRFS